MLPENLIQTGDIEEIERLIQESNNIDSLVNCSYGINHTTPLQIACSNGYFDLVCLLLQNGANINQKDNRYGWTALHCAAQDNIEICDILLKYGADISITNNNNTSAFHYICKLITDDRLRPIQLKILNEMLKKGQDINIQTKSGETALHQACLEGNIFTCQYLINHKADINISNKYGENPLHYACRRGVDSIVLLLLKEGLNPNIEGGLGTPLEIAEQSQHHHIVELINQYLLDELDDNIDNDDIDFMSNINDRKRTKSNINLGRLQIAPEARRFSNIRSILIRNMEISTDNCLVDCYFTIHIDDETQEGIYKSDVVYHTRQPTWHIVDVPKHLFSLSKFHLNVWDINTKTCIFAKSVYFPNFTFIGTTLKVPSCVKSILILELTDGYYVHESIGNFFELTDSGNIHSKKKMSYNRKQLQNMIKLNQKLEKSQAQTNLLKSQINELLPAHMEEKRNIQRRNELLLHVKELKKQIEKKEKQISINKQIISDNYNTMTERLKELSAALTTLMVDKQLLKDDHKALELEIENIKNLIDKCNLRRAIFINRLRSVYPITQSKDSQAIPSLCIGFAPLPSDSDLFSNFEDQHISTALGFVAHVVYLLSYWLNNPLPYPIDLCGSHSSINDPISNSETIQNRRFPLYMGRGVDRTRLEYGLYLLNINLQQLMHSQGLTIVSLRDTLPNLQILLIELTKVVPSLKKQQNENSKIKVSSK